MMDEGLFVERLRFGTVLTGMAHSVAEAPQWRKCADLFHRTLLSPDLILQLMTTCVILTQMRKTVVCSKCQRPFLIEGPEGTTKPARQGVVCPYKGCWEMNEVQWPLDSSFKVTEIYISPPVN